jgi:hypothetical protein
MSAARERGSGLGEVLGDAAVGVDQDLFRVDEEQHPVNSRAGQRATRRCQVRSGSTSWSRLPASARREREAADQRGGEALETRVHRLADAVLPAQDEGPPG